MGKFYHDGLIVRKVPTVIKEKTRKYMDDEWLGLYDAFNEAVREYTRCSRELRKAFYTQDYRLYIPSAYIPEYLDFERYPLQYSLK
jgi:hypothetical protein